MDLKYKYLRTLVRIRNNKWFKKYFPKVKDAYEKFNETNTELSRQLFQSIPFFLASAITGFIAFFYSEVFRYTESLSRSIIGHHRWLIFLLTPVTFLASWWLVRRYAVYAKGGGIPQVMASIELSRPSTRKMIDQLLSLKNIIVKILSSALKVLGGGIIGREGPTIQIASSVFTVVYKHLPSWWKPIAQKNILVAGAASGIAAAFNTPLGGIIFVLEELSKFNIKHYGSSLFIAVIIAGMVAQTLGGSYLYLGLPKLETTGYLVLLGVLLVSIIAGYLGAKIGEYLWKILTFLKKYKKNYQQILIVFGTAMVIATMIYFFGNHAMGSGKEIMETTLFSDDKEVAWYIPIIRMIGMLGSMSSGGAGGIFAPSLSIGASIGSVIAGLMELSGNNANMLIVIGMTAFLTGITRSPFTSAIIVIEMTDRHSALFYVMLATVISQTISYFVDKKSFYDHLKDAYVYELKQKKKITKKATT